MSTVSATSPLFTPAASAASTSASTGLHQRPAGTNTISHSARRTAQGTKPARPAGRHTVCNPACTVQQPGTTCQYFRHVEYDCHITRYIRHNHCDPCHCTCRYCCTTACFSRDSRNCRSRRSTTATSATAATAAAAAASCNTSATNPFTWSLRSKHESHHFFDRPFRTKYGHPGIERCRQ